jgi:formate dehydrogenase maturation protein FdhE
MNPKIQMTQNLNQTPTQQNNPAWCEHMIRWCNGWIMLTDKAFDSADKWKFCPMCGMKRPKAKKPSSILISDLEDNQ